MTRAHRQDGFTLIELMMAVLIMGIVTGQLFMVFSSQKRTFSANQRVLDVQEDARLVVDLIAFDARNAGFMVPALAGFSSQDGATTDPDRICLSDASYFDYPMPGGGATVLDGRRDGFAGATIPSLFSDFIDDFNFNVNTLDIDGSFSFSGSGATDFSEGAGVILSNGSRTACAEIESITGARITVVTDHQLPRAAFVADGLPIRVIPAILYGLNGMTLERNGLTLATNVEDLQVEYWVDGYDNPGTTDDERGNGVMEDDEFPIHDLNDATPPSGVSLDPALIRRVTIGVITRTAIEEAAPDGTRLVKDFSRRPPLANRDGATSADGFQRRRFTASILPKNLL
jgi:prepilin-type N-terminal cleavage/methylation domain-containing protein